MKGRVNMHNIGWELEQNANFTDSNNTAQFNGIALVGDNLAHIWRIAVYRHGKPADLSGFTAKAYLKRSDGASVYIQGMIDNNMIDITLPQECCTIPGKLNAYMKLTSETGQIVAVASAQMTIGENITNNTIDPGQVAALQDKIAQPYTETV